MNSKFSILTLWVMFFIGSFSQRGISQALLLDKGEKGTLLGAGLNTMDGVRQLYGGLGFSPNGKFNIGLHAFRVTEKEADDLSVLAVQPYLEYFFIKQDDQTPLSMSLTALYTRGVLRSDYLKSLGIDVYQNGFGGNLMLAHSLQAGSKTKIIPYGRLGYYYAQVDANDGLFTYESTDEGIEGSLGCVFSFPTGGNAFNIAPSILIDSEDLGFGIYFSLLFK